MPGDNFETLWLQKKLIEHTDNRALQAILETGRGLPCIVTGVDGSLVTVQIQAQAQYTFPPLTIPKAESQWLRTPTQIGDVGITVPASTFLAGISGQGSGIANIETNYGNLSSLIFVPVAATNFAASPNPNKAWINGPAGAHLGDAADDVYVDCDKVSGTVTIRAGGKSWTFGSAGLTMSSGTVAETHLHGGVQGGTGDTGPPIP